MRLVRFTHGRLWIVGLLAVASMAFGMTIWQQAVASAANCDNMGRTCRRGYFSNGGPYYSGHNLFSPPTLGLYANNAGQLIGMVGSRMACVNAGNPGSYMGVPQTDQNGTSSSFIVLTMLGAPPGTPKNRACERWNEWVNIVNSYDSAGLIRYNQMHDFDCVNTAYSSVTHDVFYYDNCGAAQSIVFYNPSGQVLYAIKRDCGNPIGILRALPPLPQPSGRIHPPTPGDADSPPGYLAGDTSVYSSCRTISGRASDPRRTNFSVRVNVTYRVGTTVIATDSTNAASSGTFAWSLSTPPVVRNSPDPVRVSAVGVGVNNSTINLTNSPITIGPCLKASPVCAGVNWNPASLDPSTPYTVTANIRYGNVTEASAVMARSDTRFFVTINGPGVNRTITYTPSQINRSGQTLSVTTPQQPATGQAGVYRLGYGINGSFGAIQCAAANAAETNPPTMQVTARPYFTVRGGDVVAGAGIDLKDGRPCTAGGVPQNQAAGVVGWNRGSAHGYAGAGSQYGISALRRIQDFASGQGSALAPTGMSLANTGGSPQQVDVAGGLFGGELGSVNCVQDYFERADDSQIRPSMTLGGETVPNCNGANADVCRKIIYVDGNVYITGDIRFSGSYANMSQIPSFTLVVRGNIYIAPTVQRLDGMYIAQPSNAASTNGVIYTCATSANAAAALDGGLLSQCASPLTVNGAFAARQVWLLRSSGSVTGAAAETFNYSPELWLSVPGGNGPGGGSSGGYDSITALPPVL